MNSSVPNVVQTFAANLAWIIATFAVLIVVSGILGFLAARLWGKTKRGRQAIFGIVGFAGLMLAALITVLRLLTLH